MLTHRELKAIQEGNRRHPDVMTLLREVKRLRELAALLYSVLGYMPTNGLRDEDRERLRPALTALMKEPAVQEYRIAREKMEALEFRRRKAQERNHVRQDQTGQERAGIPRDDAVEPAGGPGPL